VEGAPLLMAAMRECYEKLRYIEVLLANPAEWSRLEQLYVTSAVDGRIIGWIGQNQELSGAWFQNLYVGGANPLVAPIIADANGNVSVNGSVLVTGSVTAGSFNILLPIISGTFTSNNPSAGRVSWASAQVVYAGTTYTITNSDTNLAYVYWDVGNTTFTAGDTFTESPTRFMVLTNSSGTVDVAWSKIGKAGVQRTNLGFPLLEGFQLKAIATLNGNGNVINDTSQTGVLLGIGIEAATAPTSNADIDLTVQIDGATTVTYKIYDSGTVFAPNVFKSMSADSTGTGAANGDFMNLYIGSGYRASCKVDLVVNTGGGSSINTRVWRAHKT
jgi:hypothetical protein